MSVRENVSKQDTLTGRRVYLRPFERDDLPYIQKWSNDAELRKLIGEVAPMRGAETERWYKELLADKDRMWFVIVLKRGDRVIGEAGLLRMFRPWRHTDMTIISAEILGKSWLQKGRRSQRRVLLQQRIQRLYHDEYSGRRI